MSLKQPSLNWPYNWTKDSARQRSTAQKTFYDPPKPPRVVPDEEGDPRELRVCIICGNFLEDDDAGEEVVNSEDCTETATLCRNHRPKE